MARTVLPLHWPPPDQLPEQEAERFVSDASGFWEAFYRQHRDSFFKDRHYLEREFPALAQGSPTILEVGCGVGNTAFPLLEANPRARVWACDFSPTAIACVRQHPQFAGGRLAAFAADLTADSLARWLPPGGVDLATAIFVLSAISPERLGQAVANLAGAVRPGGSVFVRDYAAGDMAEERFAGSGRLKRLAPRFYVRGDGTCAYYFTQAELAAAFERGGFRTEYVRVCERTVENRGLDTRMERRWIQALFTRLPSTINDISSSEPAAAPAGALHPGAEPATEPPAVGEWLEAQGSGGESLQGLFAGEAPPEMVEEAFEVAGAGSFRVRSLSREHKHTLAHTGLLLWDSSLAFARFLARCPALLQRRRVLELGSGCNPLCLLAALRHAARVVATDGSPQALQRLAANIDLNASKVLVERARLRRLAWGDAGDSARLLTEFQGGFDVILGSDVVYEPTFVAPLFRTAALLLAEHPQARLLLCHITRRVDEPSILIAAAEAGFVAAEPPQPAAEDARPRGIFRLLCFARAQPVSKGQAAQDGSA